MREQKRLPERDHFLLTDSDASVLRFLRDLLHCHEKRIDVAERQGLQRIVIEFPPLTLQKRSALFFGEAIAKWTRRNSRHDLIRLHVFRDDGVAPDHGTSAYFYSRHDHRIVSTPHIVTDGYELMLCLILAAERHAGCYPADRVIGTRLAKNHVAPDGAKAPDLLYMDRLATRADITVRADRQRSLRLCQIDIRILDAHMLFHDEL